MCQIYDVSSDTWQSRMRIFRINLVCITELMQTTQQRLLKFDEFSWTWKRLLSLTTPVKLCLYNLAWKELHWDRDVEFWNLHSKHFHSKITKSYIGPRMITLSLAGAPKSCLNRWNQVWLKWKVKISQILIRRQCLSQGGVKLNPAHSCSVP